MAGHDAEESVKVRGAESTSAGKAEVVESDAVSCNRLRAIRIFAHRSGAEP
jgi:hypothetical protein